MDSCRLPKDFHLFEASGHRFAFNPNTYGIAILDEVGYDLLSQVSRESEFAANEVVAKQLMCSLVESHFLQRDMPPEETAESVTEFSLQALCLIITSQCNLRCDYCYNDGGRYAFTQRHVMTNKTANNAIDFLLDKCERARTCHVSFFGGEPLSRFPLIKEVVGYALRVAGAQGVDIAFHVTTNGTLIAPEIAEFLHQHDFSVIISIDGDEMTHNFHRKQLRDGKGSYELAVRGAKMLVDEYGSQDKIMIRGTYTHQQKSLCNSFLYLRDYGFQNISIEPCFGADLGDCAIRERDLPGIFHEYERLSRIYADSQSADPQAKFFHFQKVFDDLESMRRTATPCGAANGYMAVAPDGGLYPCHRIVDERYRLGSVNDTSRTLDDGLRKAFLAATTDNRATCRSCWARTICGGSCYANSIDSEKDIYKHDEVGCAVTRMFIEHSIATLALKNLRGGQQLPSFEHATIVHAPSTIHASISSSSCPIRASCDYGCQASCTSSCTSGCMQGCTSGCTGGCTAHKN